MWVIGGSGFVSLVQDKDDPDLLQVRGRDAQDIRESFPGATVYVAEGADYRYRARVAREEVVQRLAEMVRGISYTSHFKDEAVLTSPPNPARLGALYGCWTALAQMQDFAPYSTSPRAEELHWWEENQ